MNRRTAFVNWLGQTAKRSVVVGTVFAAVLGTDAYAGPDNAVVINGNVVFSQNGNWYTINASDGAIINYSAFDIAAWETVQFIQPHQWARVLNRITGPDPSSIDGKLLANGNVYFVNPAGIMFGPNSIVNVGGIYAAAGSITNQDFMSGINRFVNLNGGVMNQGAISAESVHLIGGFVSNQGTINANGGVLTMLAGDNVIFQEQGDNIAVYVDGHKLTNNLIPPNGTTDPSLTATAGVENSGIINVKNGQAVLGAGDLYSLAVNNTGLIRAESGSVTLAANDGLVRNAGVIDVSSIAGNGGSITMQGPSVINEGSLLADSQNGQAGDIEVTSQNHTYLLGDSVISAAGIGDNGQGGTVLVHSYKGLTVFDHDSSIDVSSGAWGQGGFAEVSGKHLLFRGYVKLNGLNTLSNGTLLIDPLDLYVVNGDDINTQQGDLLFTGNGGNIVFNNPDTTTDLYISAQILESFFGDIILQATRDLFVQYRVMLQNGNNVTLEAGRDLFLHAPIMNAASLMMSAGLNFDGNYPVGNVTIDILDPNDQPYLDVGGPLVITGNMLQINNNLYAQGITLTATGNDDPGIAFGGGMFQVVNAGAAGALNMTGIARKNNAGHLALQGGSILLNNNVSAQDDLSAFAFGSLTAQDLTADAGTLSLFAFTGLDARDLTAGQNVDALFFNAGFGEVDNVNAGNNATFVGNFRADGNVMAGNNVTFGQSRISGNVTAGNNATFAGDAEFDGAADQTVTASAGTADFNGNVSKTTAGSLGITGAAGIELAGNATAMGDLTLDTNDSGAVTLDGIGDQSISSTGGNVTVADGTDVNKTTDGALTMTAATLNLGGDATTSNGNLLLDGNVDLNSTIEANGDQTLSATGGTLTATGNVNKTTDGNVTVNGANGIAIAGNMSTTAGNLAFTSANGTLDFNGIAIDQTVDVNGGSIQIADGLDAMKTQAGSLTLDGENGIEIGGNVSSTGGSLTFASANGIVDFNGTGGIQTVTAPANLIFTDGTDVTKSTDGELSLYGEDAIWLGGNIGTTNGDLRFATDGQLVDFNGTGGNQIASALNGNLIFTNSNVAKTTDGDLALLGDAGIQLDGNVSTTNGDLNLQSTNGVIDFQAQTAQSATAVGGSVIANADVTKSSGSLSVDGENGIQLAGNITTLMGSLNLTSANGNVDFNGTGDQMAVANDGDLNVTGDTDVTKSTAGSLTLDGETGVALSGDATTTAGDLNFVSDDGPIDFNGTGNQTAMAAGGSVSVEDGLDLTKSSAGDLTVDGETGVQLGGNVSTSAGNLTLNSSAGTIDLNGTGDQSVSAISGMLDINALVAKTTAGNFTLTGDMGILAASDVSVIDGNLMFANSTTFDGTGNQLATATGDLIFVNALTKSTPGNLDLTGTAGISVGGDAMTTGGDLLFHNDVEFNGVADQAVLASGLLMFDGNANKTGGNLTLTGTNAIMAMGNVTGDGDVNFMSMTTFGAAADQMAMAAGELVFATDVTKTGTGNLELAGAGGITVGGNATAVQALSFLNDVHFTGTAQTATATDGALTFGGNVAGDDALTLSGSDGIDFNGAADQSATAAGDLRFENVVAKSTDGSLTLGMSGGKLILMSDASTSNGDLILDTDAELASADAQTLTAGGGNNIVANGDIDKALSNLTLASATNLTGTGDQTITVTEGILKADGMINKSTGGALSLEAGMLIDLTGGAMALDNLLLNTTSVEIPNAGEIGFDNVPLLATIVGRGDLLLQSANGDVLIGGTNNVTFEKITAFNENGSDANVTINALNGKASIADITATGAIFVSAATIEILLRQDGRLDRFDGDARTGTDGFGRPYTDFGTDFVARTGITFSGNIVTKGNAAGIRAPSFATVDSSGVSTNIFEAGFLVRALGTGADLDRVFDGTTVYDLRAFGPTNTDVSNAIAGAAPRESESDEVGQGIGLSPGDLTLLRTLGIYARNLSDAETLDTQVGRGFYNDYDGLRANMQNSGVIGNEPRPNDRVVAVPRIPYELIQQVFAKYESKLDANRTEIKTSISEAWTAFADEVDTEAMEPGAQGIAFSDFCTARPEHAQAANYIADLRELFQSIEVLGLNGAELDGSHEVLASYVRPPLMERDVFQAAVKSGMGTQGAF